MLFIVYGEQATNSLLHFKNNRLVMQRMWCSFLYSMFSKSELSSSGLHCSRMIFAMHVLLLEVGVYPGELAVIFGIVIWLHVVLLLFPVGPWGVASPFPVELRIIAKLKVTAKMWMT